MHVFHSTNVQKSMPGSYPLIKWDWRRQGSVPWNKGKKLSLETRLRMSLARKGYNQSKTTRRKISKAHTNLPVAPVQAPLHPQLCSAE